MDVCHKLHSPLIPNEIPNHQFSYAYSLKGVDVLGEQRMPLAAEHPCRLSIGSSRATHATAARQTNDEKFSSS
jgi:hypothetical protein